MNNPGQVKINRRSFLKLSGLLAGTAMFSPFVDTLNLPLEETLLDTAKIDKPRLRDLAEKLGIEVGISLRTIDRWKLYQYPEYLQSILQFALIKDGYTNWPESWLNNMSSYEYLAQLARFAKKNKMGLSLDNLSNWNWFQPPHEFASLRNGTREQLDALLIESTRKHMEVPYFTDLSFASEPTGASEKDPPYWNDSPLYRLYGEDWPEMTYHLAWDEAQRIGRKVGEDLSFVYAIAGQIEVPNSAHAEYEYKHLTQLREKLAGDLGIERPFAIGMEYHIHYGAFPYFNGCWGPSVHQLNKPELIEHFQRFNEIGDVMLNESSITGTDDPEKKKEALHIFLEAAIESKVVKRVLFWTPFFQPTGDTKNDAKEKTCDAIGMFKDDYTPDYMFDEMYKIFESYVV